MPSEQLLDPWRSFFDEIDAVLDQEVVLHCLGGFVAKTLYALPRGTADVDVLPLASNTEIDSVINAAREGSELHRKYGVYLQVVGLAPTPEAYESRLTEMFPGTFRYLRLFALDPYDLALTKIERNSQRDRDYVKHLARMIPFDLEILRRRFDEELKPDLGNPDRESLTFTTVDRCHPGRTWRELRSIIIVAL
jgi:hypothetical protein